MSPVGPHLRSQRKSDPIGIFMRPYGSDIPGVIRNMRTRFLSMRSVIIEAYLTCLLCPWWVPLFQYLPAEFCDYVGIPNLSDVFLMAIVSIFTRGVL